MGKAGRPQLQINWDEFEKLCAIHSTLPEIAAWFRCSEDTIQRAVKRHYKADFAVVFQEKKGIGKISLRRTMFQKALAGNPTMMIWLSKNELGYADKLEQKIEDVTDVAGLSDQDIAERAARLNARLAARLNGKPQQS